jgi:hypothetical protein
MILQAKTMTDSPDFDFVTVGVTLGNAIFLHMAHTRYTIVPAGGSSRGQPRSEIDHRQADEIQPLQSYAQRARGRWHHVEIPERESNAMSEHLKACGPQRSFNFFPGNTKPATPRLKPSTKTGNLRRGTRKPSTVKRSKSISEVNKAINGIVLFLLSRLAPEGNGGEDDQRKTQTFLIVHGNRGRAVKAID